MRKYFTFFFVVLTIIASVLSCSKDEQTLQDKTAAANRKNKENSEAYIKAYRDSVGVFSTSTGLLYKVDTVGTGIKPGPEDSIHIVYTGTLANGTMFAASRIKMTVDEQIAGMREGVQLMSEGSVYDLYIPHYLAYGEDSNTFLFNNKIVTIPPYAALHFHVKLEKVVPVISE